MARKFKVRFGTTQLFLGCLATKDLQNAYNGWLILQAMPRHPVDGVEGSKPRLGPQMKELSAEYLAARNRGQAAKAELAEIALLGKRGTLISRQLAGFQAAYLLTCFRQQVLAAPVDVARRLVAAGLVAPEREHDTAQLLREAAGAQLAELAELPRKVVDPNWIAKIDSDLRDQVDGGGGTPASPVEIKREADRAKVRREKQTQAARARRVKARGRRRPLKPAVAIDVAEQAEYRRNLQCRRRQSRPGPSACRVATCVSPGLHHSRVEQSNRTSSAYTAN